MNGKFLESALFFSLNTAIFASKLQPKIPPLVPKSANALFGYIGLISLPYQVTSIQDHVKAGGPINALKSAYKSANLSLQVIFISNTFLAFAGRRIALPYSREIALASIALELLLHVRDAALYPSPVRPLTHLGLHGLGWGAMALGRAYPDTLVQAGSQWAISLLYAVRSYYVQD